MSLRLDYCSYEAAKFAVEHWHYSKTMPRGKLFKIGVWENSKYIGCILYSGGAGNIARGEGYGMKKMNDIVELSRVALCKHQVPVSKILSISIKMLKKQSPNLKMIISFSDELDQGHLGIIYQAMNFIYTGTFRGSGGFIIKGKKYHDRSVYGKGWVQSEKWLRNNIDINAKKIKTIKHRYLYPLSKQVRNKILPLSKPYPKRLTSKDSVAADNQSVEGGASPTVRLL